jgi:hypothetical protein
MKDEQSSLVYVLADYKQLVLQYKSKFTQLTNEAAFWRAAAVWSIIIIFCLGAVMYFWIKDARAVLRDNRISISQLGERLRQVTVKLDETKEGLRQAKDELRFKGEAISRLEQGVSTASKRLVENLLRAR